MTPAELHADIAAREAVWRQERNRLVSHAWHVAAFTSQARVGKLQDLRQVLAGFDVRRMTPREANTKVRLVAELFGMPARKLSAAGKRALERLRAARRG